MEPVRIYDGDPASLERRVARAAALLGEPCAVEHFTHWWTGRPPVHEATLSPGGAAPGPRGRPAAGRG